MPSTFMYDLGIKLPGDKFSREITNNNYMERDMIIDVDDLFRVHFIGKTWLRDMTK